MLEPLVAAEILKAINNRLGLSKLKARTTSELFADWQAVSVPTHWDL